MASMFAVLRDLKKELIETLGALEPDARGTDRYWTSRHLEESEIEDSPGKPRAFVISFLPPRQRTVGSSTRTWVFDGLISVGYPKHGWDIERASDIQQIADALSINGGQSDVSGVSYRLIDGESIPEPMDTDDWTWQPIPIMGVLETS